MKRIHTLLAMTIAIAASNTVYAGNCSESGGLGYLGNTRDGSQSIWLSTTSSGSFELDAAQGNQTVDQWTMGSGGLHLSNSPVVSNGNGGTHKLYGTSGNKPCLLDTQNQKRNWPGIGGMFPEFQLPQRPGGNIPLTPSRPTVPDRPVHGITPELPGGVTPPISTLPPDTLTPGRPTMPDRPEGLTPGRPTMPDRPPQGLTPELPGGVTPPIGTLPPGTGTVPVTPTRPTMPDRPVHGITPEMPGGVTPPIGTLPPGTGTVPVTPTRPTMPDRPVHGITPEMPGGVTPPIGTLPPGHGTTTTPEAGLPSSRSIGTYGQNDQNRTANPCRYAIESNDKSVTNDNLDEPCDDLLPELPLTHGREFDNNSPWNTWVDTRYNELSDKRNNMDVQGYGGNMTVGVDRRIGNMGVGVSLSKDRSSTNSFDGAWTQDSEGYEIGPYLAYQYSENWVVDTSVTYGHQNNDEKIVFLEADYTSENVGFSANATGQYPLGKGVLRPTVSLYYSHNWAEEHDLSGIYSGRPIELLMEKDRYDYAYIETSAEYNQEIKTAGGDVYMPYVQLALRNEFQRPNDGKVMTGNLSTTDSSPWIGATHIGMRNLITPTTFLEVDVGYLSLGKQDLDMWEYKLYLSHSF